jgi:hypothetical protein
MFGPNQVGELIVGDAYAAQTTVATFVSTAADKAIKVLSKDGTNVAANKPFYLLQKTAGDAAKGLNYEFSDKIDPRFVEKITLAEYVAPVMKAVKIDGFNTGGVVAAKRTYEVEIRVENQLSPENFELITGYYITGEILGSDNATTVRDGVLASINKNLARRGNSEFTVTADGTGILVTEKDQPNVPGKISGRRLLFTVTGKVFDNVSNGYNSNLGLLTSTQTVAPVAGSGTGKFATNFEWFVKGYKYDADRQTGYPADFGDRTPFYTSKNATYNTVQIKYFSPRTETAVERQYKVLTILVVKTNLASNAVTNSLMNDLRTAIGTNATVPANLAVA